MQSGQGRGASNAVVCGAQQAHFHNVRQGARRTRRTVAPPPQAGSPHAMTPFNMIGMSYVAAIALLTLGAMAV
jgi:hypothetical protein